MKLYGFQKDVLKESEPFNRVAYYYDMGLGKTFIGAEKLRQFNTRMNIVVCQKSKLDDWIRHFICNYNVDFFFYDLTNKQHFEHFFVEERRCLGFINYDLLFRRPELAGLKNFTLLLDESSLIQNETSKRTKFIMKKLKPDNVILLSGTPTGGKYEKLWSQLNLLGLDMSKKEYWNRYVKYHVDTRMGFPLTVVDGYKNVYELKGKMRKLGCFFKKTEEVFDLPEKHFIRCSVPASDRYKPFMRNSVVKVGSAELVGDTPLTKLLYARLLCGAYNTDKIQSFKDLAQSTSDRLIVFYNYNEELGVLMGAVRDRKLSVVNGKTKNLDNYNNYEDSITFIQYQAGAMGLNLQKANKIVYFTPPLSSELYEQSKKRIHRIGQDKPCLYYNLICKGTVEENIYNTLALRKDYTDKLFMEEA